MINTYIVILILEASDVVVVAVEAVEAVEGVYLGGKLLSKNLWSF